jgi:pyruvate dehydrogenase kinase 2/3/4
VELSDLPLGLNQTESIQRAIQVYSHSIQAIRTVQPPQNATEDLAFTEIIRKAKGNGANLVPLICGGLRELAQTDLGHTSLKFETIQDDIAHSLDKFFLARIGIRMLIGQHVESMVQVGGRVERMNVEETVRTACDRATNLCRMYLGVAPDVEIRMATAGSPPFTYVESHLHHMIFELVKNAMRATVEFHRDLQLKAPGRINKLEPVMDPNSQLLGFVMPDVRTASSIYIYRLDGSGSSRANAIWIHTAGQGRRYQDLPRHRQVRASWRVATGTNCSLPRSRRPHHQSDGQRRWAPAQSVEEPVALWIHD